MMCESEVCHEVKEMVDMGGGHVLFLYPWLELVVFFLGGGL